MRSFLKILAGVFGFGVFAATSFAMASAVQIAKDNWDIQIIDRNERP